VSLPPHIEQTLTDIADQRARLDEAERVLRLLYAPAGHVALASVRPSGRRPAPEVPTPSRVATPVAAARPRAKVKPAAAPSASRTGQWDGEVRDALALAPATGVTVTEIARRLVSPNAPKADLEQMVQRVWGALQRFCAAGEAVKDGRHYRRAEAA
jgi:hypothetical protein